MFKKKPTASEVDGVQYRRAKLWQIICYACNGLVGMSVYSLIGMKLWHINDRGTRISGSAVTPILKTDSMELGTGNMDLDSLMAQALTIGVDAVILESHRNWVDNSPIKSLQLSAEYLKQHG